MKKYFVSIVSVLLLQACASSKPSCSVGLGLGCQSVMEVNTAINHGYGSETLSSSPKAKKLTLALPTTFEDVIPEREEEQWLKVWVPSHVDENNNYHPEHTYYTVIQSSKWKEKASE